MTWNDFEAPPYAIQLFSGGSGVEVNQNRVDRQYQRQKDSHEFVDFSDLQIVHKFPRQGHDILQRQLSRKWSKIELYLEWRTNSQSYMPFSR